MALAAVTSLKTIANAVQWDKHPLLRTVRWRTVANTLSMGLVVCWCSLCSAGTS